jgi:nicotinamide-nucleotide amidase
MLIVERSATVIDPKQRCSECQRVSLGSMGRSEVAAAMARGMRERAGVSVAVSVTGIAGPGGATEAKPVGLVYIGLDGGNGDTVIKECRFHGDRFVIKQRAAQAALDLLRRWLIGRGKV